MSTSPSLVFLPWLRRGLARGVSNVDGLSGALPGSAAFTAELTVSGMKANQEIRLLGPGHVLSFADSLVRRLDPPDGATAFAPEHFPCVELHAPELPWLFTPAKADTQGRLRPWLALVVIAEQEGVSVASVSGRPFPTLTITSPAQAAAELPDLAESWAWAHVQVALSSATATAADTLKTAPHLAMSRLVCARKLAPRTRYIAAVVPTFEAGRLAGLGQGSQSPDSQTPAWDLGALAGATVELPCYRVWRFATSAAGDFETLARALQRREVAADMGVHGLSASDPGGGLAAWTGAPAAAKLSYLGALCAAEPATEPWNASHKAWFQAATEPLIEAGARRAASPTSDPVVAPPLYGSLHASTSVPDAAGWQRELNLNPTHRVAAGLGARVVQRNQEALVASAWDQIAGARALNGAVRQAELGAEVGRRLQTRLGRHTDADLVQITRGAHPRLARADAAVQRELSASTLPAGTTSGAMARVTRPGGLVGRALKGSSATVTSALGGMTSRLASAASTDRIAQFAVVRTPASLQTWSAAIAGPSAAAVARTATTRSATATSSTTSSASTPITGLAGAVRAALQPSRAVWNRLNARAKSPGGTISGAIAPTVRYDEPLYQDLVALGAELLMPGVGSLPDDSVTAVETNPAFIAAFLVGANHEMSRELLWREVPVNTASTWFSRFWDRVDPAATDIQPLVRWGASTGLAGNVALGKENIVLLIRGELLRRYPATAVYAVDAEWSGTTRKDKAGSRVAPTFTGTLGHGVSFFGFPFSATDAKGDPDPAKNKPGRFFALEQPATDPVFGLDAAIATDFGRAPVASDGLSWGHLFKTSGELSAVVYAPINRATMKPVCNGATWGQNAAHQAELTFQRPFRALIHASVLLP